LFVLKAYIGSGLPGEVSLDWNLVRSFIHLLTIVFQLEK